MKKYYIVFNEYERGIITNALNGKQSTLLMGGRYTYPVGEVKIVIYAKKKRLKIRNTED